MQTINQKIYRTLTLSLVSFTLMSSLAYANGFFIPKGVYGGIFGGWGSSDRWDDSDNTNNLTQSGTALYPPAAGGPLVVHARGTADDSNVWIVGAHLGYELPDWCFCNCGTIWKIAPAVELEGFYLNDTQHAHLINPTTRLPEHNFDDSLPIDAGVFMVNSVWTLKTPYTNLVYPYLGAGVGAAYISINDAQSQQRKPPEPHINHFNSNSTSSDWTFAAQVRAGLRFNLSKNLRVLAEYRFLYFASSKYTFGSTQYPTHVPTTRWDLQLGRLTYNIGSIGLDYSFC